MNTLSLRHYYFVLALITAVLFTNCTNQEWEEPTGKEEVIKATGAEKVKAFDAFLEYLQVSYDDEHIHLSSDAFPHPWVPTDASDKGRIMTGITAWNNQVPLHHHHEENTYKLPINPENASQPGELTFIGPIAVAIDGIPIFNPIKQDGHTDVFLAGELDECGGHAGRADDYHYHITPQCVLEEVGEGKPVAFALDGYPIYGYLEPDGTTPKNLDELRGHDHDALEYHYHGSPKAPYIHAGFKGKVNWDDQPRAIGVREAQPGGAKVNILSLNKVGDWFKLSYADNDDGGKLKGINYKLLSNGCFEFQYVDETGQYITKIHCEKGDGGNGTPPPPPVVATQLVPDTGASTGYTNIFGEDNDYTINPMNFKLKSNGVVKDQLTGLMWESTDAGEMTYEEAVNYASNLVLDNKSDWRLPNAYELFTIINFENHRPALDGDYFTDNLAEYWWTSTPRADDTNRIWSMNMGGGIGPHQKTETISAGGSRKFHVRCVRGKELSATHSYTDHGDGTVTDQTTGLEWQSGETAKMTWEQAISYAENLSLGGHNDWRLPNIKELRSINEESRSKPSLNTTYFPNAQSDNYWSSTSQLNHGENAWYVSAQYGIVTYTTKTTPLYVRCVRTSN